MNARRAQRALLINEEKKKLQTQLGSTFRGFRVRCITAVARSILLHGNYSYNGKTCVPKAKSLGAGVYEVWLEDEKII